MKPSYDTSNKTFRVKERIYPATTLSFVNKRTGEVRKHHLMLRDDESIYEIATDGNNKVIEMIEHDERYDRSR